jgi:hypothetical protein
MRCLSRRFSGFIYLYIVLAGVAIQAIYILENTFGRILVEYFPMIHFMLYYIIPLAVLIIPLIIIARRKYPITTLLRINTFSFVQLISVVFLAVLIYLFSRTADSLISKWCYALFSNYNVSCFTADNNVTWAFWPNVISACLIPALVQGLIFPGVIYSGLRDFKPFKSSLFVSMLYALYIQINMLYVSPLSIVYYIPDIIVYFSICYICFRSDSVIQGIFAIFIYHLLKCVDFADWLYKVLLSPLGVSDILTAVIFIVLSIVLGGFLIWKFPKNKKIAKVLNKRYFRESFSNIRNSLSRLTWLPGETESRRPAMENTEKEISGDKQDINNEIVIYPDDTEKQKKNTGYIISISILVFLFVANVVLYLVFNIINN